MQIRKLAKTRNKSAALEARFLVCVPVLYLQGTLTQNKEDAMAIDVTKETLLSLKQAVKAVPRAAGEPEPHFTTIYRWMTIGRWGVRLEFVRFGKTMLTSAEAIARFGQALAEADQRRFAATAGAAEQAETAATEADPLEPAEPTERQQERNKAAARKRLARAGILTLRAKEEPTLCTITRPRSCSSQAS